TASTSGEKVGVPECDDFLAKYEACVSGKVPAAAQSAFKTSMETWRNSWKELAKTPQGKAGLATTCKSAADLAKASLGSYGSRWRGRGIMALVTCGSWKTRTCVALSEP